MSETRNGFTRPTLRAALTTIRDGVKANIDANREVANRYSAPCALGMLMTEAQRKDLLVRGLDCHSINGDKMMPYLHRENVEFITGMTLEQAAAIQSKHDCGPLSRRELVASLDAILTLGAGTLGTGTVRQAEFNLEPA